MGLFSLKHSGIQQSRVLGSTSGSWVPTRREKARNIGK
ncbi:hypothetical protein Golob_013708 [Gossypium lobatum]|uniref:Uncharacterized protein n=2 Tax=Gossypium TaxID=3633 RepID=A0A7J8WZZ1_GOSAI|nr:hypothetical protein [Gossypium lobatum]MBA0680586.1 hypothetical protein [Gossypium aridum]